jgi:hypothetical protein
MSRSKKSKEKRKREREAKKKRLRDRQSRIPTPPNPRPDLLIALPALLRNKIYEFVLHEPEVCHLGQPTWREPALLKVSKRVRREALRIYYITNSFILHLGLQLPFEVVRLSRFLKSLIRACQRPRVFGSWKISVEGVSFMSLLSLLPLFKTLFKTEISSGGIPQPTENEPGGQNEPGAQTAILFRKESPLFMNTNRDFNTFLDRLREMAEYARAGKWSEEHFEATYRTIVAERMGSGHNSPSLSDIITKARSLVRKAEKQKALPTGVSKGFN